MDTNCQYCGAPLEVGALNCAYCGSAVPEAAELAKARAEAEAEIAAAREEREAAEAQAKADVLTATIKTVGSVVSTSLLSGLFNRQSRQRYVTPTHDPMGSHRGSMNRRPMGGPGGMGRPGGRGPGGPGRGPGGRGPGGRR